MNLKFVDTRFRLAELSGSIRRWRLDRAVKRIENHIEELNHLQQESIPTDPERLDELLAYSQPILDDMMCQQIYLYKVTMNETLDLPDDIKQRITPKQDPYKWYANLVNVRYGLRVSRE